MSHSPSLADRCLLIIDVQRGFVVPATSHIPDLVGQLQHSYTHVIASRFYNPEGSMYRKLIHWGRFAPGSDDTLLAFTPRPDAFILDKPRYSCLGSGLLEKLNEWNVSVVDICGIDTDICVTKNAVDLFEIGITPRVLSQYCGSHGGIELHEVAIKILRRYIGSDQVV